MYTIKKTAKLRYLLEGVEEKVKENFKSDKEGLYSITKYKQAEQISKIIIKQCKLDKNSIIMDACSCVGGNLLSFCKYFKECYGFEIDEKRYKFLKNNLKFYDNIKLYNISSNYFIDELIKKLNIDIKNIKIEDLKNKKNKKFDVIFFDPPWGGEDYKNKKNIDLFLDDINLYDIIKKSFLISNNIVLKVPNNYNFYDLQLLNLNLDIYPIVSSNSSFYYIIIISIHNLNSFFDCFYKTNKNIENDKKIINKQIDDLSNKFDKDLNNALKKNNDKLIDTIEKNFEKDLNNITNKFGYIKIYTKHLNNKFNNSIFTKTNNHTVYNFHLLN